MLLDKNKVGGRETQIERGEIGVGKRKKKDGHKDGEMEERKAEREKGNI